MAQFTPRKLFFKHLYGGDPNEWGVIGFPKRIPASKAMSDYVAGGLVLLAVTKDPQLPDQLWDHLRGKIFGVATLAKKIAPTHKLANPAMIETNPMVAEIWDQAAPIHEFWEVAEPKPYSEFAENALSEIASRKRGHLIDLTEHGDLVSEITSWLADAEFNQRPVYHSADTDEFLRHIHQIAQ